MSRLLSHRHPWLYWLAVRYHRYHRCRRTIAWRLEKGALVRVMDEPAEWKEDDPKW